MGKNTNISWCSSTWNPWIGCTRVSPGCDGCYAAVSTPARAMEIKWGAGEARKRTSPANWVQPLAWDRKQASMRAKDPNAPPWRVFCASLADVFDNEVPNEWRYDLFKLIQDTPNLSWLLVTKRIGNVEKMMPQGWQTNGFPPNVRLMITVVNQEEAYRDLTKLLSLPCKNGVSYEPALGPVDWKPWLKSCGPGIVSPDPHGRDRSIEWLIVGGESSQGSHKARPFAIDWARSTMMQCKDAGVPCFFKQAGSSVVERHGGTNWGESSWPRQTKCLYNSVTGFWKFSLKDRAGADPSEWPEDLRVQEFPT